MSFLFVTVQQICPLAALTVRKLKLESKNPISRCPVKNLIIYHDLLRNLILCKLNIVYMSRERQVALEFFQLYADPVLAASLAFSIASSKSAPSASHISRSGKNA